MTDDRTFGDDVEHWVREHLPGNWDGPDSADPGTSRAWFAALAARGWTVPTWDTGDGGAGLDDAAAKVIRDVLHRYDADLPVDHFVAVKLIGPAIIGWGSDAQRHRFLPGIVDGSDMWCQLFSEPGAGSDLASLATRAVPAGDGTWRVTGQKVWSSFAHRSTHGMLLARTDPDATKGAGITCFLLDMAAAGVTARPLRQLTGSEHFSEVFLDDVALGEDAVLGAVGGGWKVAMSTLTAERSGLSDTTAASGVELAPVVRRALREGLDDVILGDRLTSLVATERALTLTNARLRKADDGRGSITKLVQSELSQRISEFDFELSGRDAAYWDGPGGGHAAHGLLDSRRLTVAGGTSEIQRNIIAERVLGLDREPDAFRGKPWREIPRG